MKVKGLIFFDLDDTLYPMIDDVIQRIEFVSKVFNLSLEIKDWWINEYKNNGPKKNNLIDEMIENFDLNIDKISLLKYYREVDTKLSLDKEIKDGLLYLKSFFHLIIVTNGLKTVQKRKVINLGLHLIVDKVYYASGKRQKPSPFFFQKGLEYFGVPPTFSISLGDWYEIDGKPCEKLGIDFVYYDRPIKLIKEYLPNHVKKVFSFSEFIKYTLNRFEIVEESRGEDSPV